jgi:putative endonuclease
VSLRGAEGDEAILLLRGAKVHSKQYCVYILASNNNKVLYTGISGNLKKRIYEHKEHLFEGFTKKYNVNRLLYFEVFDSVEEAIKREKQIKSGSRKKKEELINRFNKNWKDLYDEI